MREVILLLAWQAIAAGTVACVVAIINRDHAMQMAMPRATAVWPPPGTEWLAVEWDIPGLKKFVLIDSVTGIILDDEAMAWNNYD